MPIYVVIAALAVVLSLPLLWWSVTGSRQSTVVRTNTVAQAGERSGDLRRLELSAPVRERAIQPFIDSMARRGRRITPAGRIEKLDHRIQLAGSPPAWSLDRVLALKVILALIGGALGLLHFFGQPSGTSVVVALVLAAAGYFAPDLMLGMRGRTRQALIQQELPDTLDQITVSVEAGLGFDSALARAGRTGTGPLAEELLRVIQDIQIGVKRSEALKRMEGRSSVPELRLFIHAIIQAESYGIPIAKVLRTQATELRDKRTIAAEERAQKVAVKLLFPLVFCILPGMFIVVLGPVIISIVHAFSGGG